MTASKLPGSGEPANPVPHTQCRPPAAPVAAPGPGTTPIEAAAIRSWMDETPERDGERRFREAEQALAMVDGLAAALWLLNAEQAR